MKKTKIEWCDSTWNPVTGCLHGCEYCYARKIANRFKGCDVPSTYWQYHQATWTRVNPESSSDKAMFEVDSKCPPVNIRFDPKTQKRVITKAPYPWGFQPTLRRDKLLEPQKWTKPRTIFVCSMADLFGEWVPDSWIEEVFAACEKAPQHRYMFLTKNPGRYCDLQRKGLLPQDKNIWFGATYDHSNWGGKRVNGRTATFTLNGKMVHDAGDYYFPEYPRERRFVSFEPLLYNIGEKIGSIGAEWVIIGAESGNRKGKIIPQKEWVDNIVEYCDKNTIPVFMKDSLIPIVGEENMRREFPWEV